MNILNRKTKKVEKNYVRQSSLKYKEITAQKKTTRKINNSLVLIFHQSLQTFFLAQKTKIEKRKKQNNQNARSEM